MYAPIPGGGYRATREPEWDWIDRAIMAAWRRLNAKLCRLCGRPLAVHDTDEPDDYNVGALECTATKRLAEVQAEQAKRDEPERERGLDPDRHRMWVTWTEAEGPPITE